MTSDLSTYFECRKTARMVDFYGMLIMGMLVVDAFPYLSVLLMGIACFELYRWWTITRIERAVNNTIMEHLSEHGIGIEPEDNDATKDD